MALLIAIKLLSGILEHRPVAVASAALGASRPAAAPSWIALGKIRNDRYVPLHPQLC